MSDAGQMQHYYVAAAGLNHRELINAGDIVLYYPRQLSVGFLPTHLYQNYRGYGYFDNLCTHAAISLGADMILDAMPGTGVTSRPFEPTCEGHIFRVRRITRFDESQMSKFLATARELEGADYNALGILGGVTGLTNTIRSLSAVAARAKATLLKIPKKDADTDLAEAAHSFYCSQLVEYCYTAVTGQTFPDIDISELFPPAAISHTRHLQDVALRPAEISGREAGVPIVEVQPQDALSEVMSEPIQPGERAR